MSERRRLDGINICLYAFLALTVIYIVAPLIIVVVNSFNSASYSSFPPEGFSLRWYENLFQQKQFLRALGNSLVLGVLSTVLSVVLATLTGLALTRYRIRGAGLLRSFFLSPIVVPKIVLGLALFMFFLRVKLYQTLFSVVLAHTIVNFPFALSIIYAGLQGVKRQYEEAAADLGARPLRTFFDVVLPQIRTSLLVASLFSFIISFDQVETTLFLVRGASNTLPIEMFLYMERWQDPTMAALSSILIGVAAILLVTFGGLWQGLATIRRD